MFLAFFTFNCSIGFVCLFSVNEPNSNRNRMRNIREEAEPVGVNVFVVPPPFATLRIDRVRLTILFVSC